jgi:L,D-transpeptidase ErfK/SrfK
VTGKRNVVNFRPFRCILGLILCLFLPSLSAGTLTVGEETFYVIQKGDSLLRISSKLGVSIDSIMKDNGIDETTRLAIGRKLKVNTKKIVPKAMEDGIVINIPDRTLYFFRQGRVDETFPVGLGMPAWNGRTEWRTPEGRFKITGKEKDPTWFVPESIQWKMEQEEKDVLVMVPPGPTNPLGRYAVKTSLPGILIHETIWPLSISRFRSHGCVRVAPEHMEPFYRKVQRNLEGEIIYAPIKAVVTADGRVLLEVHRDVYKKIRNMEDEARLIIERLKASRKVNWQKVDAVVKEKRGVPQDISF